MRKMGCRLVASIVFLGWLVTAWATVASAANGDLDPSFGVGGVARAGISGRVDGSTTNPAVQPDGRFLICGNLVTGGPSGDDFLVVRFSADGALDPTFNFDGHVGVDFGGNDDRCTGLVLQLDGRIVVAGTTTSVNGEAFAIARLNADGSLDTTFGGGTGKTTVAFDLGGNSDAFASALALQPDGKIIVAGNARMASGNYGFAVARLLPDGTRDGAFNLTGRVTFGFNLGGWEGDYAQSVAIDAQGRIVLAGTADNGSADFAVARLLPNGQLDPDFDADGRVTVAFDLGGATGSNVDGAFAVRIQRNGRIVLAGFADSSASATHNYDMALARLLPSGALDASFGSGGKTLVPFDLVPNGQDYAYALAEQANGKLVVAGYAATTTNLTSANVAAVRLNVDGSPDAGFGSFGRKILDFGFTTPGVQAAFGIALQGTRILLSGFAVVDGSDNIDLVIAGLQDDLLFANGFE